LSTAKLSTCSDLSISQNKAAAANRATKARKIKIDNLTTDSKA